MRKKLIIISIILIILTGGAVLCTIRWNAWFGNPPEADYVVPVRPNNIICSFGKNNLERTIAWRCDTLLQDSYLALAADNDTSYFVAEGKIVPSRNGVAAFYQVRLTGLKPQTYSYQCVTGKYPSPWRTLTVNNDSVTSFLLFGDVQDQKGESSTAMFSAAFSRYPEVDAVAFVGDIIERPMDSYYQLWFRSMQNKQETTPIIAATGNHEYLKGVVKTLDSRWTSVFVNPDNGPQRFAGRSYFIDFPAFRYIVIDTDGLQTFPDYTITQTWVLQSLREARQPWKIVMMHHPVYSAGHHRDNPLIWLTFHSTLKEADVVFCGHDHNYMRRGERPVYLLTTSSEKFYKPKPEVNADKHAAYQRFYEYVTITPSNLTITTINTPADTIFDYISLSK